MGQCISRFDEVAYQAACALFGIDPSKYHVVQRSDGAPVTARDIYHECSSNTPRIKCEDKMLATNSVRFLNLDGWMTQRQQLFDALVARGLASHNRADFFGAFLGTIKLAREISTSASAKAGVVSAFLEDLKAAATGDVANGDFTEIFRKIKENQAHFTAMQTIMYWASGRGDCATVEFVKVIWAAIQFHKYGNAEAAQEGLGKIKTSLLDTRQRELFSSIQADVEVVAAEVQAPEEPTPPAPAPARTRRAPARAARPRPARGVGEKPSTAVEDNFEDQSPY